MKFSQSAVDLIKHFESFRSRAYLCPAGVWTIGWGSTQWESGEKVKPEDTIDAARAEQLLLGEIVDAEAYLRRTVTPKLEQYQFDALVSFIYNTGRGAFGKSTLRTVVNSGDMLAAPEQFIRWTRASGEIQAGLLRRRLAEIAMWTGKNWEAFR